MTGRIFAALTLILVPASAGFGGGVGGGGNPPSIELNETEMEAIQAGIIKGEIIRYTEPGLRPIYLHPSIESIDDKRISAAELKTGILREFHLPSDTDKAGKVLSHQMARSLIVTIPGFIPILPDYLEFVPKAKIESVSKSEIEQESQLPTAD